MKKIKGILLLLAFITSGNIATAQSHTEKIVKEFNFSKKSSANVVQVENIFGSVDVETHNSDKVVFEVERIIRSNTADGLKKAEELTLEFDAQGDSIISYFKAPYIHNRSNGSKRTAVNINGKLGYSFEYNFKIKVPQNTNVAIHTINNGVLAVRNLAANKIVANNVNGPITLENIAADVHAKTVNGNVLVTYKENPKGESHLETLNGNVELLYNGKLSAVINFSSFNGDFYTDLEDLEKLPAKVQKTSTANGAKTKYKVDKASSYKTGGGAAQFDLKTFNGKVIVKAAG